MPRVSASLAWICPTCASSTCGGRTRCVSVRSRPLISLVLSRRRYARYGCRAAAARPRDPARRGPRWPRRDGPDRPRRRGRRPPAPHGAGSRPAARAKSLPSHLTEAASYRSGSWSSIREQITKASSSGGGAGRLTAAEHTPSRLPRSRARRKIVYGDPSEVIAPADARLSACRCRRTLDRPQCPEPGAAPQAATHVAVHSTSLSRADRSACRLGKQHRQALALLARLDRSCSLPQRPAPLGEAAVDLGQTLSLARRFRRSLFGIPMGFERPRVFGPRPGPRPRQAAVAAPLPICRRAETGRAHDRHR